MTIMQGRRNTVILGGNRGPNETDHRQGITDTSETRQVLCAGWTLLTGFGVNHVHTGAGRTNIRAVDI